MDRKFLLDPSNFDQVYIAGEHNHNIFIWITLYGECLINFTFFRAFVLHVSGDIDDLEFWLSTDATPAKQTTSTEPAAATTTEDTPTKTSSKKRSKKKGRAKVEPTPEVAPVISTVMDEPEGEEGGEAREEEEGKRRKKKGEKVNHEICH